MSDFLSAIAGRVGSGRVNISPGRVGSRKSDSWTTLIIIYIYIYIIYIYIYIYIIYIYMIICVCVRMLIVGERHHSCTHLHLLKRGEFTAASVEASSVVTVARVCGESTLGQIFVLLTSDGAVSRQQIIIIIAHSRVANAAPKDKTLAGGY